MRVKDTKFLCSAEIKISKYWTWYSFVLFLTVFCVTFILYSYKYFTWKLTWMFYIFKSSKLSEAIQTMYVPEQLSNLWSHSVTANTPLSASGSIPDALGVLAVLVFCLLQFVLINLFIQLYWFICSFFLQIFTKSPLCCSCYPKPSDLSRLLIESYSPCGLPPAAEINISQITTQKQTYTL